MEGTATLCDLLLPCKKKYLDTLEQVSHLLRAYAGT